MRIKYHGVMFRIKSLLHGSYSTKAQRHLGKIITLGFNEGIDGRAKGE